MMLALAHAKANTRELLRQPGYWAPSVAFPALFFVFFGIRAADEVARFLPPQLGLGSEVVLTPFLLFGVLSIMFFHFGVGIAEERRMPWERTLQVLPVSGMQRFAGRVLTALVFSVASLVPVMAIAMTTTQLGLDASEWPVWLGAIALGGVPFGLMGIALGYLTSPKAALPIANIGFLLLSFLGGLFVPLEDLPSWVRATAPFMPTRHWLDFALGVIGGREDGGGWQVPGLYLLVWALVFGVVAVVAYRRDEGVRYR
jgi:ABC-2 type transport system permease protein